jgi:putative heme iron utilization protein
MNEKTMSNQALARDLLATGGPAALATLEEGDGPFASYVVTAPGPGGEPRMLLSTLAVHTRNLARDPRASLLVVREPEPGSDVMTAARLSLTGRCVRDDDPASRDAYLERHPDAAGYAGFKDFALYRFEVRAGHLVAGFGRIVGFTRDDLVG